jgi:SAM-dependent methyltransferase
LKLNDSELVRREYENEQGLTTRRALWTGTDGVDPWEVAFDAVREVRPRRVLEVGAGPGEFAERLGRDLGAEVITVDLSPRMVELAQARGVEARLGDVQELEFEDGSFDCSVAAWMLYHVADLDRGLGQLARILRPGGRLVAITNGENNLAELWALLGPGAKLELTFTCENAGAVLARHFRHVRGREAVGTVTIATREDAHRYVSATVTRRGLADRLPEEGWPLRATRTNCVFVAEKAAA